MTIPHETGRPVVSMRQAGYRDLLLALVTYPDRPPEIAMTNAAQLAVRLGGEVTALALKVRVDTPRNRLADLLLDFDELVHGEEARSAANARSLTVEFEAAASPIGAPAVLRIEPVTLYEEADRFAQRARSHDLAMIPYGRTTGNDRAIVEALLFQSGRPVLLFPDSTPLADAGRLGTVTVAWDGGRASARALADALPLLATAERVTVLVVTGEKADVVSGLGAEAVRHLAVHGVSAELVELDAGGRRIGDVLAEHVAAHRVELLVMGAFGRSRARELVLGGATRSALEAITVPVLMSH